MNKKKIIGKAALLLSLPMILGAVDGLKTSYAVEEGRSVVQIKEDSTKTGHSIKNENKKVNKARYKVITWLQGLTDDKDYTIEKVIEREGKIGDLTYYEAPEIHTGFEFTEGNDHKGTIDSDGSTIVNLYYNRLKHSLIIMTWDESTNSFKQTLQTKLKYGESTEKALSSIINDEKGKTKKGIFVTSKDDNKEHIHPGFPTMKNKDLILYVNEGGKEEYTTIYHDEKGQQIHKDTNFFGDGRTIDYNKDDAMDIPGYTPTDPSRWKNVKGVHWEFIFYTKNTYKVSLFKRGEVKTFDVKYEEQIGKVDEWLSLPKGYIEEINGEKYQFAGWYDNPEFKDNAESEKDIDIAKLKMPAHNMAFFAKWTPLNDDKKEEESESQDDANTEIHKEEEKAPDKETTPPVTPDKPQDPPKDEDKPSIPEEGKEDNQDKGEDSDKEMNDDNSKENEGKEENKEESEKPKEEGKIEPEEDEVGPHKEDSEGDKDEGSEDEEEIEEDEEESEEEDEDYEDDEEIEEEDEDSEDEEEIESDKEDEDDPQSDEPQDDDKKNEDTSKDKEKEKNNNSDKKEPQKDDKDSDKIDEKSENNDKDESKKEDHPESKDEDKKDTEEESEDDEDNSEIEEDEEESEEEEDEENEEDSKEKTDELESLRKAKYACLYDKLKTALDKYKVAIENLKKYKEKCIKDGESEDYIQKIDDVLEHANRLIKRGDNLLNRLEKMK